MKLVMISLLCLICIKASLNTKKWMKLEDILMHWRTVASLGSNDAVDKSKTKKRGLLVEAIKNAVRQLRIIVTGNVK